MLHIKPETVAGGKEMFQRTQLDTTAKVGRRCRAARPSGSSALPVHGDGDGESESAAMPTAAPFFRSRKRAEKGGRRLKIKGL